MTTINITVPVAPGEQAVFTLRFNIADFDAVIEASSKIQSIDEIENDLWEIV